MATPNRLLETTRSGGCQSSSQRRKWGSSRLMASSTCRLVPNFGLWPSLTRRAMILSRLLESSVGSAAKDWASRLRDIITRPAHGSGIASAYLA